MFGELVEFVSYEYWLAGLFGAIEVWQIGYFCLLGHDHPLQWLGVGFPMDNDVECGIEGPNDGSGFDHCCFCA